MTASLLAVTARVTVDPRHGERRDALDQRWGRFLLACGFLPVILPNDATVALAVLDAMPVSGVVMTGGNSLAAYGGDAPERDALEVTILAWARTRRLPVMGVCRGMQVILHAYGARLQAVSGHAGTRHAIDGGRVVNSYHDFAASEAAGGLAVLARSADGMVESVAHDVDRVHAIMWHPERADPFDADDIALFRGHFLGEQ